MRAPVLDLFSGYGGFSLAFESVDGFTTIGFSEIDPYASALLAERFPHVPNFGPVESITRAAVLERCGVLPVVVTGGFPCQPHSVAGKRGASADDRDLWGECARVLGDLRPRFALFENVPGLLTSEQGSFFNRVLSDLAGLGYACLWQTVSAADMGAPHRRDRIFLLCWDELADGAGTGLEGYGESGSTGDTRGERPDVAEGGRDRTGLADPDRERREQDSQSGELRANRVVEPSGHRRGTDATEGTKGSQESMDLRVWPALAGLWPARPGEPQYEWEPPRVVADASRLDGHRGAARAGRGDGGAVDAATGGAGPVQGGQAEPKLGGDADGPTDGVDPTQPEVRQAEGRQMMWLTPRANEPENDTGFVERNGDRGAHCFGALSDQVRTFPGIPGPELANEMMWRTPTAEEAGAKLETLFTKDGQPARPGERAYRLQPDGRLVLQSQTIGQQVLMDPGVPGPGDSVNRTQRLKLCGNGVVPACVIPYAMALARFLTERP